MITYAVVGLNYSSYAIKGAPWCTSATAVSCTTTNAVLKKNPWQASVAGVLPVATTVGVRCYCNTDYNICGKSSCTQRYKRQAVDYMSMKPYQEVRISRPNGME